jgi:ankyrin repeat protein
MFAYLENKQEIIDYLENQGFMVGAINSEGQNLLHLAAIYKRKEAFMSGLKKKLNHNLADNYGNTPLHYGCRSGELDIVEALLAGKS